MKQTHTSAYRQDEDIDKLIYLASSAHLLKEKTRINLYLPKAIVKIMDSIAKNQSRSELVKNLVVEKAKQAKPAKKKDYFGIFSESYLTDKDINEVTNSWDRHVDELIK